MNHAIIHVVHDAQLQSSNRYRFYNDRLDFSDCGRRLLNERRPRCRCAMD